MAKMLDPFTQRIAVYVPTQGVSADAFVYKAVTDAYKPSDMVGWVIKEVRYYFENSIWEMLNTSADRIKFGLMFLQTHPTGGPEPDDAGILDHHSLTRYDLGAPAADVVMLEQGPVVVRDFTNFEGEGGNNGMLVHPVNFFVFGYNDTALGTNPLLSVIIEYKTVVLTDALYKELWQSVYIRQV